MIEVCPAKLIIDNLWLRWHRSGMRLRKDGMGGHVNWRLALHLTLLLRNQLRRCEMGLGHNWLHWIAMMVIGGKLRSLRREVLRASTQLEGFIILAV